MWWFQGSSLGYEIVPPRGHHLMMMTDKHNLILSAGTCRWRCPDTHSAVAQVTGVRGAGCSGGLATAARGRRHLAGFTADDPGFEGSG